MKHFHSKLKINRFSPIGLYVLLTFFPASAFTVLSTSETAVDSTRPAQTWDSVPETKEPATLQPQESDYLRAPASKSPNIRDLSPDEITLRRDLAVRMQKKGFGLMMGGIAAGIGGLALMIYGVSQIETHTTYDPYYGMETTESRGGEGPIIIGYLSFALLFPGLLTPGIILNRIGNHRRIRYQSILDDMQHRTSLQVGYKSVKLTYDF